MKDAIITFVGGFIFVSLMGLMIESGNMSIREIEVAKYNCLDVATDFYVTLRSRRTPQHVQCLCTDKGFIVKEKREFRPYIFTGYAGDDVPFYGAWVNGKYRIELENSNGTIIILGAFNSIEEADEWIKNNPCAEVKEQ